MSGVLREEWLLALQEAETHREPHDPNVLTRMEFAALVGCHPATAKTKLKLLIQQGRASVTKKPLQRGDGVWITVPAYRLVKESQMARTIVDTDDNRNSLDGAELSDRPLDEADEENARTRRGSDSRARPHGRGVPEVRRSQSQRHTRPRVARQR